MAKKISLTDFEGLQHEFADISACEKCGALYITEEQADACEKSHVAAQVAAPEETTPT